MTIRTSVIRKTAVVAILIAVAAAGFYGVRLTLATTGPSGPAGTGSGAIAVDSSSNLAVGTTTVLADTRLYILGGNSTTTAYAIQLKNQEGRPLFVLRNDGRAVIGPFPIGGPPTFPSASTLQVRGLIETVDSTSPNLGGGVKFPDGTIQTTAGGATASAANVSSGAFGANTGGGNYSFPASLGVGTTTPAVPFHVAVGAAEAARVERPGSTLNTVIAVKNDAGTTYFGRPTTNFFAIGPNLNLSTSPYLSINTSGNVGIGTVTPNAKLTIANNVATGFLDTYGEYQQILYDGGSAATSYGFGIKENTMVFNSGNGGYSFDRGGLATSLAISNTGLITVGDRITGLSAPTASSDAATKAYVDSAVGVQYIGRTTATYTGNLGGIAGANAKCNAQGGAFAGSHMCTQGEALRTGATSFVGSGWIACDLVYSEENCMGVTYSFTYGTSAGNSTCVQWTWGSDSTQGGPVMSNTGNVTSGACNVSRNIHCCK